MGLNRFLRNTQAVLLFCVILSGCGGGEATVATPVSTAAPPTSAAAAPNPSPTTSPTGSPNPTTAAPVPQARTAAPATGRAQSQTKGEANVHWEAPQYNENGSKLTDLAGYRVHYGRDQRALNLKVSVGPKNTDVAIEELSPGIWYFAVVAFNKQGMESDMSDVKWKEIG